MKTYIIQPYYTFSEADLQVCFDEMVATAEVLAKDFPHVRVDFYDVQGQVVFGELTFYNASGYTKFTPDEFDFIMGEQFKLPPVTREDKK